MATVITSPLRVRQEFSTVEQTSFNIRAPHEAKQSQVGKWDGASNSLERQHDAIAVRVLLLVDVDLTVDHGHNPISKLSNIYLGHAADESLQ